MSNIFVIADTHFGHTNTWAKFKCNKGNPLRPFNSTEEMDEAMVDRWNAKVGPHDIVYHLGDVAIAKRHLQTVLRLNGKKRLIRGNHDIFKDKDYRDVGFEQIWGVRVFVDKFILSHIPLHPDCVGPRFVKNVHGHLHGNVIRKPYGFDNKTDTIKYSDHADPLYKCVSVEHTNYTPVAFEEL